MFCRIAIAVRKLTLTGCILALSLPAIAQHTVRATYNTLPTGPNSEFSVNLTLDPANIDIVEYRIAVGYDSLDGDLISVTDNTGQPQAGVNIVVSNEGPLSGVYYADKYRGVALYTEMSDLLAPVNIGQLNFRTSASYNDPQNRFYVYLSGYDVSEGAGDQHESLLVNDDGQWKWQTANYDSLEPMSSVSLWSIY